MGAKTMAGSVVIAVITGCGAVYNLAGSMVGLPAAAVAHKPDFNDGLILATAAMTALGVGGLAARQSTLADDVKAVQGHLVDIRNNPAMPGTPDPTPGPALSEFERETRRMAGDQPE